MMMMPRVSFELWSHQRPSQSSSNVMRDAIIKDRKLTETEPGSSEMEDPLTGDGKVEVAIVVVTFEDILKMTIFLMATWLLGRLSHLVGAPSLVGEIICGFLLGPPLANFAPFPEAMVLIGNIGLLGLILESGMDIDVAQLKESGPRAAVLAVAGTTLPLLAGLGVGSFSTDDFRSVVAVGAAFAPSSLGVSSNVLSAGQVLNTPIGQLIVASSVVDDVLGLILLSILEVLVQDDTTPFDFVRPFIASFGFLLALGWSGVTWIPWVLEHKVLPRIPEPYRESAAIFVLFLILVAYMPLLNYAGASYLTGAFLAGLSFSQIHSIHAVYAQSTRSILNWLMRVFFAATIGFQVPVRFFGDPFVLRWGVKLRKCPLFV
jgi:Kef-type K+ transport system membrane component KefB